MTAIEFENMIIASGLTLEASIPNSSVFLVSLRTHTGYTARVRLAWIEYRPGEFANRPYEACRRDIEAKKAELLNLERQEVRR